jgi:hypothetical protein
LGSSDCEIAEIRPSSTVRCPSRTWPPLNSGDDDANDVIAEERGDGGTTSPTTVNAWATTLSSMASQDTHLACTNLSLKIKPS